MRGQIGAVVEIIADNFAGGGGASEGIKNATGRHVTIAINHDPDAIAMHKTNHPYTEHYQENVWNIDPAKICAGRPVGLAWFSPDCKHFSKAKGGKPVDKNIRGLAWVVLRWAGTVRPRVIVVENVEEFQTWGPVRRGKPVKSKAGQTFKKFIRQLEDLEYAVEHRELVAADYGVPTIRKRFFLIARCDDKPIVWPEPTHSKDGTGIDSHENRLKKWRAAAEIIDWSIPCPSIFDDRKQIKAQYGLTAIRPLRPNTMRRIARGVDKFVIKNAQPFIVQCKFNNDSESIGNPLRTVTSVNAHLLCAPSIIQYHSEQSEHVRGQRVSDPIMTIDGSNRYAIASAHMTEYFGNADSGFPLTEPTHTATAKDREGLTMAFMSKFYAGGHHGKGNAPEAPLNTITANDHNAVAAVFVSKFYGTCTGHGMDEPLHTVTQSPGHFGDVRTILDKWDGCQELYRWPQIRELLNTYCEYSIADDEILLLEICGAYWFISDIGLRMLTPRELYNANGFPPDYIIDRDYDGREYGKSLQVARCGNAVPPPFAKVITAANLPEWCGSRPNTSQNMKE